MRIEPQVRDQANTDRPGTTRFDELSPAGRLLVMVVFAGGVAAVFFLLPFYARFAADLSWMPWQDQWLALGDYDSWFFSWRLPIGLLIGALIGMAVAGRSTSLVMTDDRLTFRVGDEVSVINRGRVGAVEGKRSRVTVRGLNQEQLFHAKLEANHASIREAFQRHRYPWQGD